MPEPLNAQQWRRINDLFHAALEREADVRADYLAQSCAGDEGLRREVEALLWAHERADAFFGVPAMEAAAGLLAQQTIHSLEGRSLGHYQVVSLIGAGGMGQVFLAEDTRLKRKVAIKVLPAAFTADPDRVRRFEREAHAVSSLNHPNIITIYEVGRVEEASYIVTEYIEGETLRRQMEAGKMGLREALDVAVQAASALDAAHKAGIVHRDIKPDNVMLRPDGLVKVLDFGLAKLTETPPSAPDAEAATSERVQTKSGLVMGTVTYMSPEQARGLAVDARSDLFSLGTVIYEMVAGRVPFDGATTSDVIVSILEREPAPLSSPEPGVPAELERIVKKALAKDREERYQLAKDLLMDLRNLKQEMELQAKLGTVRPVDSNGATPAGLKAVVDTDERMAARTTDAEVTRTVSSAEYLVTNIKTHKRVMAVGLAALLIATAAIIYFTYFTRGEAIDSIAVLPFVNVGNDPNTEYLSDGISDSLINSLSQWPGVKRVISLNAALRYKGQQVDPQTVGREFNVQAVLMGRLTQQGDGLGISVELVDAGDNRRLWGEQYNRKLSDILVVQREIAQQISSGLRLRLSGVEKKQIAKQYTENPNAEMAYLKGRHFLHKRSGSNTKKSVEYLEEAVRLDPNYALAHATLVNAYLSRALLGSLRMEDVLPEAKEAVKKALAIDDDLAEAHAALGSVRYFEWDWSGAESEFKRAIELNPNHKPLHPVYELYLLNMKRSDEAVAESKRVLKLDPASAYYNRNVGMILYFARRYDEAIEQLQKTHELDPDLGMADNWLWRAYEQKGQYVQAVELFLKVYGPIKQQGPEAVAAFREAFVRSGWKGFWRKVLDLNIERAKRGVNLHALAENYARLGERDQALFWLEKAIEQREEEITRHCRNPVWDGFRSDPRFANLIRRMGLEP